MRMRIKIGFILVATLFALPALADRRSFIRSYEFQTQPAGNLEFEMWNEVESPRGSIADSLITHKLELEYGVTDRFDVALYHVFQQGGPPGADTGFHFDSWRAERHAGPRLLRRPLGERAEQEVLAADRRRRGHQ